MSAELRDISDRNLILELAERFGIEKLRMAASFPDAPFQVAGDEFEDRLALARKLCFGSWLALGLEPEISERLLLRFSVDSDLVDGPDIEPEGVACETFQHAMRELEQNV